MKKAILYISCSLFFLSTGFSQNATNKITFGPEPFNKSSKVQNEYNWDKPIYAKLVTEKPLKNYARKIQSYELGRYNINGVYSSYLQFMCVPDGEDVNQRSSTEITLYLTDSELEKNEAIIDIMPAKKDATSFYGAGFYEELAKNNLVKYDVETGNSTGKKTGFTVFLFEKENKYSENDKGNVNGRLVTNFGVFMNLGHLTVDYTPVTDSREFMSWNRECEAVTDSINSKYKK